MDGVRLDLDRESLLSRKVLEKKEKSPIRSAFGPLSLRPAASKPRDSPRLLPLERSWMMESKAGPWPPFRALTRHRNVASFPWPQLRLVNY